MSKLDDHLKASKETIDPRQDLADKIMKAVHQLPAHKRHTWRRFSLVWATPVAVVLLIVVIVASPIAGKLNLSIASLHATKLNTSSKTSVSNPNSNNSSPGNTNSNSTPTNSTDDNASLNNDLAGIGSSINENQQSLDAAGTAISNQQLDTPPSD